MRREAKPVRILVDLSEAEAWAFAQFLKRSRFDHYRGCAVSGAEAYVMLDACEAIRRALAEAGYAPR